MVKKFSNIISEDLDVSDFLSEKSMVIVNLAEMGIERGYNINDDLTVDVSDYLGVTIKKQKFSKLPVRFGKVDNWFILNEMPNLTTLEGCPVEVGEGFACRETKITSLEGCPTITNDKSFNVYSNKLTSLKGSPKVVSQMHCDFNDLTDLKGSPEIVMGSDRGNSIFNCSNNDITSLEFGPKKVDHNYLFKNCPIYNLDGFDCDFGGLLYCENTPINNIFPLNELPKVDLDSFKFWKVIKERTVNFKRLKYVYSLFDIELPKNIESKIIENGYSII